MSFLERFLFFGPQFGIPARGREIGAKGGFQSGFRFPLLYVARSRESDKIWARLGIRSAQIRSDRLDSINAARSSSAIETESFSLTWTSGEVPWKGRELPLCGC